MNVGPFIFLLALTTVCFTTSLVQKQVDQCLSFFQQKFPCGEIQPVQRYLCAPFPQSENTGLWLQHRQIQVVIMGPEQNILGPAVF